MKARRDSKATLTIAAPERSAERVSASVIAAIERGYRAYWGPSTIGTPAGTASPSGTQRFAGIARSLVIVLGGFCFGVGSFLASRRFGTDLPSLPVAALGGAIPALVDRVVPSIEIAAGRRTRLVVISRRLLQAGSSYALAQVVAILLNRPN